MTSGTAPDPAGAPPNLGFVIAMRARPADSRTAQAAEWLIVARWEQGALLSVSWTDAAAAADDAPLDLAPRRTVIGALDATREAGCVAFFQLMAILPPGVSVAGLFVPATGTARLSGANAALRLRSEGHAVGNGVAHAWNFDAVRAAWIGEFL